MARHRKGRDARSYARHGPVREPYEFVLVACEGGKSEPNYFTRLRAEYRLSNANVRIVSPGGTDPMSVVLYAENRMAAEGYDRAFCVFDRDTHANYDEAITRIANSAAGRAGRLIGITSWPCFEVWVLLHFGYSTAPFTGSGKDSACDKVVKDVKKHLADYEKGFQALYDQLAALMNTAISNAKRLEKHNSDTSSSNPATKIHRLVDYLRKLKP